MRRYCLLITLLAVFPCAVLLRRVRSELWEVQVYQRDSRPGER
jgi:hypothetical protein